MKTRIGLVHATLNAVGPLVETFKTLYPDTEIINFLDEGLLLAVNEQGGITPEIMRRFTDLVQKAVDSNTDGVLLSCSSFSPVIPDIQKLYSIPVLSVDGAMLELAVQKGKNIGVIATVAAAGPTTRQLLEETAQQFGQSVNVFVEVVTEAFDALKKGDKEKHDLLIRESAERLAIDSDVIVLAQISMARAEAALKDVGVPVLTSPQISCNSIMRQVHEKHSKS
jgi:Asp/Glu/hydantoin racemase